MLTRRRFRLLLRILAITFGSVAGYFFAVLTEQHSFVWALLPALILFAVSLFEFALNDIIAAKTFPEATLSKMEVLRHVRTQATLREITRLLRSLMTHSALTDVPVLATAHLKIELFSALDEENELGLLQLVDYEASPKVSGTERRGGRFRVTSQYQGLIGRCLRTEQEDHVNFASEAEYHEKMVRDFGFSKDQTAHHSQTARSYYACPIKRDNATVIGVLYIYSSEPNIFPARLAVGDLRQAILHSCQSIGSLLAAQELGS